MKVLRAADAAIHARAAIDAALAAADPASAVTAWLSRHPDSLPRGPVGLVAVGKAAAGMAHAMLAAAGSVGCEILSGVVIAPRSAQPPHLPPQVRWCPADHPRPTPASVEAGQAALDVAGLCRRDGIPLLVLLSGGASSLMSVPEHGLGVDDLAGLTDALSRAGAPIEELNTVRQHCDRVKGGGLARAAAPSPVFTLVLSDVIGNPIDLIGSGPTAAPRSTAADALAILERRGLARRFKSVAAHLRLRSTSPVDGPMPSVEHAIIADNAAAVTAAAGRLTELGFTVAAPVTGVVGEARHRAFEFVAAARTARARAGSPGPVALVWGGETVVTVKGNGRGGRNLEAALAAAIMLDGEPAMTVATFATDGVDGAADAAGAIVDGRTAALARQGGRDPEAFLAANDSLGFFEGGHELLAPGPTGTNVNDVWIALAY